MPNIFPFTWSVTILVSKTLVYYIISKMLTNPAEDFPFHLTQAGTYDRERTIHCATHHAKSNSVMKLFLSCHFFRWGNATMPSSQLSLCSRRQQGWAHLMNWYSLSCKWYCYHVSQEQTHKIQGFQQLSKHAYEYFLSLNYSQKRNHH